MSRVQSGPHIQQVVGMLGLIPGNILGGFGWVGGGTRGVLVSRRMEGSRVCLNLHRLWMSDVEVLVCSLLWSVLWVLGH